MALGSYALGLGVIGHDPVSDPSDPTARQALAPLIHPGSRDAVLVSGGALQGVHPVDQAVSLAFAVRRGSLASLPTQGHGLGEIEYGGPVAPTRARLAVEQALGVLLGRGDISLVSTAIDTTGGLAVVVTYRNLRLPADPGQPSQPTTLRVPVT